MAPGILAIFVCGGVAFLATTAVYLLIRRLGQDEARRGTDIGDSLRNGLKKRGGRGGQAWQAITQLPEDEQRATFGYVVDDLEEGGFALYRTDETGHA